MVSIVLSGQGLQNLDIVDIELKNKSKTVNYIDLSNNYLIDFNVKFNFINLQILNLDKNALVTIKFFPVMKNLDTFSVNDNKFSSVMEFSMYCNEKFPNLKLLNTLRNPMNPGYESYDQYIKYRTIIKKIKTIQQLDGIDINDSNSLEPYKSSSNSNKINLNTNQAPNLFSFNENGESLKKSSRAKNELESVTEEIDENDINNIIKMKKRQSTITYSQRMLKKADNLTKFNRKNHSEGNKHITNNDL